MLATLVGLGLHAAAQDPASVTYAAQPDVQFPTNQGTLQGVALHAGTVLTQSTTRIAAYQDGALVRVRDTTQDGSYGAHNGDGAVLGNRLFISTSSYPDPLHTRRAAISIYDASTLAFLGEWTPQGARTGAGGGVGTDPDGSLWWPFAHQPCQGCPVDQVIHQLDADTGSIAATYPLNSTRDTYAYQSCDWLPGSLLLCPMHGGAGTDYADLYHFDGAAFTHAAEVPHYTWTSTNAEKGTERGSQGFAVQVDQAGRVWTWWAGRDAEGNGAGSGDVVRVPTTVTSPTPDPEPDPDGPDDPPNDPDVAGGGHVTRATTGLGALAAAATGALLLLVASQHRSLRAQVRAQPVTFAAVVLAGMAVSYAALVLTVTTSTPA